MLSAIFGKKSTPEEDPVLKGIPVVFVTNAKTQIDLKPVDINLNFSLPELLKTIQEGIDEIEITEEYNLEIASIEFEQLYLMGYRSKIEKKSIVNGFDPNFADTYDENKKSNWEKKSDSFKNTHLLIKNGSKLNDYEQFKNIKKITVCATSSNKRKRTKLQQSLIDKWTKYCVENETEIPFKETDLDMAIDTLDIEAIKYMNARKFTMNREQNTRFYDKLGS